MSILGHPHVFVKCKRGCSRGGALFYALFIIKGEKKGVPAGNAPNYDRRRILTNEDESFIFKE